MGEYDPSYTGKAQFNKLVRSRIVSVTPCEYLDRTVPIKCGVQCVAAPNVEFYAAGRVVRQTFKPIVEPAEDAQCD